jgi:pimeloyl-ACP methyl ester carboxylesterase
VSGMVGVSARPVPGGREEAGWVERGDRRTFVFLHLPDEPVAALVVCSPLGGEADTNRRREVLLARALAAQRVAVVRHDYRGTGNSDGSPAELTFDSMLEDSLCVIDLLAERSGLRPAVLGTRLAALVAVAATSRTGTSGLVLWHPCRDGAGYFRELGRMRRMSKLAQQADRTAAGARSIEEDLAIDGRTELAGYELHQAVHGTTSGLRLGQFEVPAIPALVLEFGGPDLSPWLADLGEAWRRRGVDCELAVVPERENWWFANDVVPEETRTVTRQSIDATAGWMTSLGRAMPGRVAS